MADTVVALFRRSLGHLEAEVPASYRHLVSALGPLVVEVSVDGGVFTLSTGQDRLAVRDGALAGAGARVRTSRSAILAVLDAEVSLAEAVESDGSTCAVRSMMCCAHTTR